MGGRGRRGGELTPGRSDALPPPLGALAAALAARPGAPAVVPPDAPVPREAAVALVLRAVDGSGDGSASAWRAPELLFVKRAEYAGDPWSGHVAFPGGRREPGDATLWETAARETHEETGLDLRAAGRLLGTLDDLYPRTPTLPPIVVRPHVVALPPAVAAAPLALSAELAAAFWVPLTRFAEPGVDVESRVRARDLWLRVPSFVHEGHTIWGMTERILRQLLARWAEGAA